MVLFVVFRDKTVSWIPESYVGICGSWPVRASKRHVTTSVFTVTEYKLIVCPNLKDSTLLMV
jgi:hypothetical protein